ncbi:hypothetical protein, conserved in T. vivax [Trypanosoma vivax Y486]|uniref:Uncharacterized protein n=1 Tax=Trypanosoma vivax (strain Y486) TaxID=1055687 RepID=F9WSM5_TRYVY|nr:hypothetical protein, conserved in T. vivax [Trypanosoma vivax Y486]|eukprot:CCD20564.1 hypothetical protein, conserved in T. vivax [Trypanosoma vivax Y486]
MGRLVTAGKSDIEAEETSTLAGCVWSSRRERSMRRLAVVVLALRCVGGAHAAEATGKPFKVTGGADKICAVVKALRQLEAGAEEVSGQCAELGLPTTTRDALAAAMVRIAAAETQRGLGASRYLENETDVRQNAPKAAEAIGLMRSAQYLTATAAVYEARARGLQRKFGLLADGLADFVHNLAMHTDSGASSTYFLLVGASSGQSTSALASALAGCFGAATPEKHYDKTALSSAIGALKSAQTASSNLGLFQTGQKAYPFTSGGSIRAYSGPMNTKKAVWGRFIEITGASSGADVASVVWQEKREKASTTNKEWLESLADELTATKAQHDALQQTCSAMQQHAKISVCGEAQAKQAQKWLTEQATIAAQASETDREEEGKEGRDAERKQGIKEEEPAELEARNKLPQQGHDANTQTKKDQSQQPQGSVPRENAKHTRHLKNMLAVVGAVAMPL